MRPPLAAPLTTFLVATFLASTLHAQSISIRVLNEETGAPIQGAFVTLLSE